MASWQYGRVPTFDAREAECLVHTFKDGLLSAVAHDLELKVGRFSVAIDDAGAVDARFDARSLEVVGARVDGRLAPSVLSPRDRRTIESNLKDDVLASARHPEIRWRAPAARRTGAGWQLDGRLTLVGRERPIPVAIHEEGERLVATARIHQPDFGIRPFTALLGTLRVRADVEIRLTVPRRVVGDMVPQ